MRNSIFFLASFSLLFGCSSDSFSAIDGGADAATADGSTDALADGGNPDGGAPDAATGGVKFLDQTSGVASSAATLTLSRPLTAMPDDLAIFVFATNGALATPPAGLVSVWMDTNGGCQPFHTEVFAGAVGTSASWKFTFSNAGDHVGAVVVYENGAQDKVQLAQGSSYTNQSSLQVNALANTPAGSAVVTGSVSTLAVTGAPAGMTERVGFAGGLGRMWDLEMPSGGPVPQRTLTSGDALCASVFQLVLGKK